MNNSAKAIYDYAVLARGRKGMEKEATLKNQNITVSNSNGQIASFQSDVVIEIKSGSVDVTATIMDDQIKNITSRAIFWSSFCQCNLNGSSLDIRTENGFLINIAF